MKEIKKCICSHNPTIEKYGWIERPKYTLRILTLSFSLMPDAIFPDQLLQEWGRGPGQNPPPHSSQIWAEGSFLSQVPQGLENNLWRMLLIGPAAVMKHMIGSPGSCVPCEQKTGSLTKRGGGRVLLVDAGKMTTLGSSSLSSQSHKWRVNTACSLRSQTLHMKIDQRSTSYHPGRETFRRDN